MMEFTELDKEIAKRLPKECRYLARNKNGSLHMFDKRPNKVDETEYWLPHWHSNETVKPLMVNHVFQSIKWEDDNPVLIRSIYDNSVLDDVEKQYLENMLRPFRKRVSHITKIQATDKNKQQIVIHYDKEQGYYCMPPFDADLMYCGMELRKFYTLNDLGLFM